MAKLEVEQASGGAPVESPQPPAFVVGLPGLVDVQQVRTIATQWSGTGQRVAVIYPAMPGVRDAHESIDQASYVQLIARDIPSSAMGSTPWLGAPAVYGSLLAEAESLRAQAAVILGPDLAALTPAAVDALVHPILSGQCDLALPIYRAGRFEGLLNQAILAPVTRALYGRRVQYPLAQDFAVSAAFAPKLRAATAIAAGSQGVLWPSVQAALRDRKICQVHLPVRHESAATGVDLSTILQMVVAPLFADVERYASSWQRIRGSQSVPESGSDSVIAGDTHAESAPDPNPMIEAFQNGQRNLHELWSLVLPPVALLELKRLSRQPRDSFRMPDDVWARIVYDFALAFRLRVLSRGHLLGAMAPLYLGWVGSRVLELQSAVNVSTRQEQLERAFEQNKPYLVQRWRWPDRFNP